MGRSIVIARARSIYLLAGSEPPREFPLGEGGRREPGGTSAATTESSPPALAEALRTSRASGEVVVCGRALYADLASRLDRRLRLADTVTWHAALAAVPPLELGTERELLLERARTALDAALRSPEEVLISLAREEERFERSVGREGRAAEAFVAVPGTVLSDVARSAAQVRERLTEHHLELVRHLEEAARRTVPNLTATVGARTAARLVAAAGGVAPLARMSSSRLQLLGARRRPSAQRGPRYGVMYLTEGAERVPPDRRAAFVRSAAALAAIAARADALTRRDIAPGLVRRREARRERLARGRT